MRLFPRSRDSAVPRACVPQSGPFPVSDDQLATLPSTAAQTAPLRCPFCQSRTALDTNQPTVGSRALRSGDLVVCAQCLAPTIVRRTKRSLLPRLTAPGASTLIDLRRHPDVRALVEALQRGDIPPSKPAVLRAPFSNAATKRRRELRDLVDFASDQERLTPPRPPIADRPDERWDIRVGVWMELKAGTAIHMVARAYAVTIEFVEDVQQHGLFPSYYRIIRRDDRVMVDDGSGVFVTWTSPSSPEAPASRSSSQSSASVSLASASQEAFA